MYVGVRCRDSVAVPTRGAVASVLAEGVEIRSRARRDAYAGFIDVGIRGNFRFAGTSVRAQSVEYYAKALNA